VQKSGVAAFLSSKRKRLDRMKIGFFSVGLMAMALFALSPTSRATPPGGGFHSGGLAAPGLMGQTMVHTTQAPAGRVQVPRVQLNLTPRLTTNPSNVRIAGFPSGPTLLPYPLVSTPANNDWARNNAWAAYNANLRNIPTGENPNRLKGPQNLLDQDRFIQMPQSSRRYNFQFSDNEIRSVQSALRRLGIYSGQVDGILGPDTRRAIEDYQVKNKLPVTG
jgi:Putative peptidoglycan binding domain